MVMKYLDTGEDLNGLIELEEFAEANAMEAILP
jgi:hypothetical protein